MEPWMGQGSPRLRGTSSDLLCPRSLEDAAPSSCRRGQFPAPSLSPLAPWGTGCALHVPRRSYRHFPASRFAILLVMMTWVWLAIGLYSFPVLANDGGAPPAAASDDDTDADA